MSNVSLDKKIARRYYKIFRRYDLNTSKNCIFDVDLNIMIERANLDFEFEAAKNVHIIADSNINKIIENYENKTFRTTISDYLFRMNIRNITKK